ncbi:hypothetical protein F2Q69_00019715 [Brassica cretica]|uniref:Uncharacterized protein n=1 Tax=Brassica cretica TaxID=69181 RepID=A0A8S9QHT2_BRACR|nr:hypothetical protein F2Q69_00019715 [Brassica cretica]
MAVVRALQSETPPTLEAEEIRLSDCKGDSAALDGDFDLVLADLKSACFLPTCSEDPEGKIPWSGKTELTLPRAWTKRWAMRRPEFRR